MDEVKTEFLHTQCFKPLGWLRFIDHVFFIWTHSEENLKNLRKTLTILNPILSLLLNLIEILLTSLISM